MRPALVEFFRSRVGTGIFVPDGVFLLALAIVIGIYWVMRQAEREKADLHAVFFVCVVTVISAYLSARLYSVIQHWSYFADHPVEILQVWKHGTASFGAYSGGAVAALIAARRKNLSTMKFLDWCAPALALGIFLGRVGCFLNGCCYGKIASLPWAMRFPEGSGPYEAQLQAGLIQAGFWSLPVHPAQLYEAAFALAILGLLLLFRNKQRLRPGSLFLWFGCLYAAGRFCNEFLRADDRGEIIGLSLPQVFCVGMIAVIISWAVVGNRKVQNAKSLFNFIL
jgi:phosphatidylglycerol:prolipoprotein diacylglycerol transferase